ncbi:MAG: hypothetical protein A2266_02410 [Bacteroidetes bacterium RIFOXYA12_FULL_40_10]|jgi:DNA-directed RNA polymerase subunit RPC12/RpoP|nr:MAG: hypothetical protein A2X20_03195 [Bacteroidetes bacterium GWE2_40_15]OFY91592.1 MAG: hypothetical protein A2266_02410 [Bacteroidetes bacterium RIFOXYA12_FULL_40_10]PKP06829.1 MAG: hypothetical protein CVU10_04525 [Bacteroidetes bacterium HGW-Bacteroidetes-5]HBG23667.1 hypothetical protein [Rikenellaceae bacterium]HBZ25209.1 hypothetical protein [Rikenellaceae bacterium]
MEIVRLISCNTAFDANIIKTKLESEEIECFITNENFSTIYPFLTGGIDIMINEKDLERAKELISDETKKEVVCPNCGSKNVHLGLGKNKIKKIFLILIAVLSFAPVGNVKSQYKCKDCKTLF